MKKVRSINQDIFSRVGAGKPAKKTSKAAAAAEAKEESDEDVMEDAEVSASQAVTSRLMIFCNRSC